MNLHIHPEHILAKKGEISDKVVIAGDPDRIKKLSSLLVSPKLVSDNRHFLVYTGEYGGEKVTLAAHGIGSPSLAIVVEELISLGAKSIIRLGTAGSLSKDLKVGDILIPNSAGFVQGGTISQYFKDMSISPAPDYGLLSALVKNARSSTNKFSVGPVFSSDAFYAERSMSSQLSAAGFIGIELECSMLFALGQLRRVKTASALLIIDDTLKGGRFTAPEKIRKTALTVAKIVLDSLVHVENA